MALQFDLVLLEPADVELLAGGAALELPTDVLFVITNDPVGERKSEIVRQQEYDALTNVKNFDIGFATAGRELTS